MAESARATIKALGIAWQSFWLPSLRRFVGVGWRSEQVGQWAKEIRKLGRRGGVEPTAYRGPCVVVFGVGFSFLFVVGGIYILHATRA